jgi:hypothetical protein
VNLWHYFTDRWLAQKKSPSHKGFISFACDTSKQNKALKIRNHGKSKCYYRRKNLCTEFCGSYYYINPVGIKEKFPDIRVNFIQSLCRMGNRKKLYQYSVYLLLCMHAFNKDTYPSTGKKLSSTFESIQQIERRTTLQIDLSIGTSGIRKNNSNMRLGAALWNSCRVVLHRQ